MDRLPGILGEIAAEVSESAAIKLAAARGGTQFEMPQKAEGSELARIVGEEDAVAIIRLIGHGRIKIPGGAYGGGGRRRARAVAMLRAGKSIRETALECGYDQRSIERLKARYAKSDDDQPQLPFDSA